MRLSSRRTHYNNTSNPQEKQSPMQQEIDDDDDAGRSSRLRIAALCLALLSVTLSAVWYTSSSERHSEDKRVAIQEVVKSSSIEQAIRLKCATCHRFSEPSILPKDIWEDTIRDMFDIDKDGILSGSLDMQETIDWFVSSTC